MTTSKISDLQTTLLGKPLDDIIVPGFFESGASPMQFHANYRILYFDLGGVFLRASVIRDEGEVLLTLVDKPGPDAYPDDEDLVPAISSIREVALTNPNAGNEVSSIHLWNARDTESGVACAAVRFDMTSGQRLFVDPSYFFGIRLGGLQQEKIWQEEFRRPDWGHLELSLS